MTAFTNYSMLYYRTPTTSVTAYATPLILLAAQPTQCMVFKRPYSNLDTITYNYNNNINYYAGITNDGTRIINIQDNGIQDTTLILSGVITVNNGTDQLNTLATLAGQLNTSSSSSPSSGLLFGNIGFYCPAASWFTQEADSTSGYSLKSLSMIRSTKIPNLYSFNITLGFGGVS